MPFASFLYPGLPSISCASLVSGLSCAIVSGLKSFSCCRRANVVVLESGDF